MNIELELLLMQLGEPIAEFDFIVESTLEFILGLI